MTLTDEMREYLQDEGLVCEVCEQYEYEKWYFPFMDLNDWIVLQADNYNNTGYPDVSVSTTLAEPDWNPKRIITLSCKSVHEEGEFYARVGYIIDEIRNRLKKFKEAEKLNKRSEIKLAGTQWVC